VAEYCTAFLECGTAVTVGTVQLPETLVKVAQFTAYPDQLVDLHDLLQGVFLVIP
jgi:hypothetical protein